MSLVTTSCVLLLLLALTLCSGEYLVYYTRGEGQDVAAGLYGGIVDSAADGNNEDLRQFEYTCNPSDSNDELKIQSMSLDPYTGKILFHQSTASQRVLRLYQIPYCIPDTACDRQYNLTEVLADGVTVPHKIGPVAMYNEVMYFLMMREDTVDESTTRATLELRKMTLEACEMDYPLSETTVFDVDACSELIKEMLTDEHTSRPNLKTMGHLEIVPREAGGLYFYTQVQRMQYENNRLTSYTVDLLEVCPGLDVTEIHSQVVENVVLSTMAYTQLGGIDYRDNKLCWTAVEYVLCGDLSYGKTTNIQTVLSPTQIQDYCIGTPSLTESSSVVTGVAVAHASPSEVVLYFGCMADMKGRGGGAMVRLTKNSDTAKSIEPHRLQHSNSTVYSGAMLLSESCDATVSDGTATHATYTATLVGVMATMVCAWVARR